MIFLNSIYQQVYQHLAGRINHFPLIRLIFLSLDKTIFYFLLFLLCRILWLSTARQATSLGHELLVNLFVIYSLLLLFLTVFRQGYFPWDFHFYWHRSLTAINWVPLVETWKLTAGKSMIDFLYNSLGNILWFVPFGLLRPLISQRRASAMKTIIEGGLLSIGIESLQFVLLTGVSDVDDVIFNTLGVICGYMIYWLGHKIF